MNKETINKNIYDSESESETIDYQAFLKEKEKIHRVNELFLSKKRNKKSKEKDKKN